MKVLVTGGTGLIGEATIDELRRRGHTVRILSRRARRDCAIWGEGVEPFDADLGNAESLAGCAEGCEAVLHIAGIAAENPPEVTFHTVNIQGTGALVEAAEEQGVRRFVYVSSLGADRGESQYHRSKLAAEQIVSKFSGSWTILRPGNVYGPGDEVMSFLLRMARSSPVIPVIDLGDHPFQPIWHVDLAKALAVAVEREDFDGQALEIGGSEITTANEVLDKLAAITGRGHVRIPIPGALASAGAALAGAAGLEIPFDDNKLAMLRENNVIRDPRGNGLTLLGITPTPLGEGLWRLTQSQPEQMPGDGVGPFVEKRFWAEIRGSSLTVAELQDEFRLRYAEIIPLSWDVEREAVAELREGAVLTAALPARGNIQMRVEEDAPGRITFSTLSGHPLAGVVSFHFRDCEDGVEFEVRIYARAGNIADLLLMAAAGGPAQDLNWETVVRRIIQLAGGAAPIGVQSTSRDLSDEDSKRIEDEIREIVTDRKRAEKEEDSEARAA